MDAGMVGRASGASLGPRLRRDPSAQTFGGSKTLALHRLERLHAFEHGRP